MSIFLGLNQLLWYYADSEKQRCWQETGDKLNHNQTEPDSNACTIWRRFSKYDFYALLRFIFV